MVDNIAAWLKPKCQILKAMTAQEYKIQFSQLNKKRGNEPVGWWITADDEYNRTRMSGLIITIIKNHFSEYNRELEYQIGLKKINTERLKCAKPLKEGDIVIIKNSNPKGIRYVKTRSIDEQLKVNITGGPQVSDSGLIYFYVLIKYKPKEYIEMIAGMGRQEITEGHFQIDQDDVLFKIK